MSVTMAIMNGDRLELIRSFVNTRDVETGTDDLSTARALVAWLSGRGLVERSLHATALDAARAREVREALRALLVANAGRAEPAGAWSALERQGRRSRVRLAFGARGPELEPQSTGVDGALGVVLTAVAGSVADGSWRSLKACLADDCRWAFIDRSRNGSRRWCDMRVCGNREKARAFRARQGHTQVPG